MATFPWFPIYPGDYLRDTSRLSAEQHGVYFLLLLDEWANGPLPDDDEQVARIARLTVERWRDHRPLIFGYFQRTEGGWVNPRLEAERAKVQRMSDAGRAGAKLRWGKEKNRVPSKSHGTPHMLTTSREELIQGKQDASASSLSSDSIDEGKIVPLRGRQ